MALSYHRTRNMHHCHNTKNNTFSSFLSSCLVSHTWEILFWFHLWFPAVWFLAPFTTGKTTFLWLLIKSQDWLSFLLCLDLLSFAITHVCWFTRFISCGCNLFLGEVLCVFWMTFTLPYFFWVISSQANSAKFPWIAIHCPYPIKVGHRDKVSQSRESLKNNDLCKYVKTWLCLICASPSAWLPKFGLRTLTYSKDAPEEEEQKMWRFCFTKFLYPLPLLRVGALFHFTPYMSQLICEIMPGNMEKIIIRGAGCLILSTVYERYDGVCPCYLL